MHPERVWMPNKSLNSILTKFQCKNRLDFRTPPPRLPVVLDQNGEHRGALALRAVAENHDVRVLSQHRQRVVQVLLFALLNPLPAQLVLHIMEGSGSDVHVESETAADGTHDVGRASLFAVIQNLTVSSFKGGRNNDLCMSLLT